MKKTLYIFQSGELFRKDNSICFETAERKRILPVEDQKHLLGEKEYEPYRSLW